MHKTRRHHINEGTRKRAGNVGFHLIILGIHFSINRSGGSPGKKVHAPATKHAVQQTTCTKIKSQLRMAAKSHHGIDPPRNYLHFSIFTLLFCFCPFGLLALIFSLKVNSAKTLDEARSASRVAKWLNIAGIIIGVILEVVVIVNVVVYFTVIYDPDSSTITGTSLG